MQDIRGSKSPVVNGICDPNKSRARTTPSQFETWLQIEASQQEMFFFKNHAENEAGRLVSDLFLFL